MLAAKLFFAAALLLFGLCAAEAVDVITAPETAFGGAK